MLVELILTALFWVLTIDIAQFPTEIKRALFRWLKGKQAYVDYSLKPFDCSLCMTWWTGLIWILVTGFRFDYVVLCLGIACFTPIIKDSVLLIRDLCQWIIDWLYRYIS